MTVIRDYVDFLKNDLTGLVKNVETSLLSGVPNYHQTLGTKDALNGILGSLDALVEEFEKNTTTNALLDDFKEFIIQAIKNKSAEFVSQSERNVGIQTALNGISSSLPQNVEEFLKQNAPADLPVSTLPDATAEADASAAEDAPSEGA